MVIWISVEDILLSKIRSANVKKVLSQKSVLTDEIDVRRLIFDSTAIFREKKIDSSSKFLSFFVLVLSSFPLLMFDILRWLFLAYCSSMTLL